MYIAAIDLGTNCFRLLIAKIELNQIIFVQKTSIITGLGKDFDTNNKLLSKKSISRSLKVLKKFSLTLKRFQISSLRAVATSVVRNSDNSQDFIKQASSILNTKIEIISGKKEAELTTIGVLNSVNITPGNKIVVDIGGGSTEFGIVDENEKINFECSINLGVVSIAEKFNLRKPISGEVTFTLQTEPGKSREIWQNNAINQEVFCHEEVKIYRTTDSIRFKAGRDRNKDIGGMQEDGGSRGYIL